MQMFNSKKIVAPHSILIEQVAAAMASAWYEIGRGQGLTSKCKNAREYARKNLEKFVPRAVDHLLDILHNPYTNYEMKEIVYDALSERMNDRTNVTSTEVALPNIDFQKILDNINVAPPSQQLKKVRDKPTIINTSVGMGQKEIAKRLQTGTAIGRVK